MKDLAVGTEAVAALLRGDDSYLADAGAFLLARFLGSGAEGE